MSTLVSGTKWVALETIIARILQLCSTLFVARVLGPEAMGTVALILIAQEVFTLFSQMGITQALIHKKNPTKEQLSTLYTVNWVLAGVIYVLVYVTAPFIAEIFETGELAEFLPVVGLSVVIVALGQQTLTLLQKYFIFKVSAVISISAAIVSSVTAILLVTLGWGIWSIILGQLAGTLTRSALAFIYGVRENLFSGFGWSFEAVRPMLSFGLYQTGAMSMNMINSRADQLIIGKIIGTSALGIYSIGSQVSLQVMQQINSIATKVAFPAISREQDNIKKVKQLYLTMIANVLLVSAPLFIGLAILSSIFVPVILGDKWNDLSNVLSILCGYVLIRSLGNMNGPLVMGLGKANWAFYWNLGLLFIVPAVIFFSTLTGKIEFVALALLVTQLFLVVIAYFYWIRRLIGPCAKEYIITLFRPLIPALLMGGILSFIYRNFSWDDKLFNLVVLIVIGTIIYMVLSMVFNRTVFISFLQNGFARRK